jgi:hypothetical protein
MDDALATIVAFVEGRLATEEFEQKLYHDPEIERVLNDDPTLRPGTYVGSSAFLFAIEQDFKSPSGVLNVHGALQDFLERRQIPFKPTKVHDELHKILLDAQPRWLDAPVRWLKDHVLPAAEGLKGKELRAWLRARLLELFKYRSKPPKWIQGPNWPINENGPLVFLGQLPITDYFHDDAAVYVFLDPKTGTCETVIQVM